MCLYSKFVHVGTVSSPHSTGRSALCVSSNEGHSLSLSMSVLRSGPRSALGFAAKRKCAVSTGIQRRLLPLDIYQQRVPISVISLGVEKGTYTLKKALYSTEATTRSSMDSHPQDDLHAHSLADPASFWGQQAEQLYWHKKPDAVLTESAKKVPDGDSEASHPHWEWFPGGEISTCYNCLDRHVEKGNGDAPAIFYDSPVTGSKQRLSYKELLDEVALFAAVLRQEGVRKGDVVLVYSTSIHRGFYLFSSLHGSSRKGGY